MMIQLHIRLPEDFVSMIEDVMEGANTTEKVRNYILSNIIGRDVLELEKARCKAKLEHIERALKENPFYTLDTLSDTEKSFLEEALDTLSRKPEFKKSPAFFNARRKSYNEQFVKSLTGKEFELLIYKFKESKGN